MSNIVLTPLIYHLETLRPHLSITVKAVEFNSKGKPKKWGVYRGDSYRLNKDDGQFDFEPSPSNRDDEFIKQHSFNSAESAAAFYKKTLHLRKDERAFYALQNLVQNS